MVKVSAKGPDVRASASIFSADRGPDPAPGTSWGPPAWAGGDRDRERPPEGAAEQRGPPRPAPWTQAIWAAQVQTEQVFLSSLEVVFSDSGDALVLLILTSFMFQTLSA